MIELVKKTLLAGVGVAALTKEKLEEVAKDFVEKGKMTEQEGKDLVKDLVTRSEESRQELQKQIGEKVEEILKKMDLAKKSEMNVLKQEIAELREALKSRES
ncbi:hypothetical protein UWK_03138 [Desulfocapsa sulfexigens DSM 10523]|uniref:Polyhydroxyalkanoate synthesis regulator phasin n=1 Tax=Desulfocapsa sulfexigens (strain DSM 10523 / SB164P1) TaxID=1167006 RepID=M1PDJ7_DESSD|nr:hypothetical protein [Desulfocapsa sulfexigens]AGF79667.1 hypothetical protein UWK_03138 [Desulfocapsa sulfexigens DSM 10523]